MSKHKRVRREMPAARASPDELVERHLGLVMHIARSFQNRLPPCVDFDDLVGAGNLGLLKAAHRYDPARNTNFSTYARHRIRGAIMDSLRQADPVSRHLRSRQKRAERAVADLATTLGRHPTEAETAKRLQLPLRDWQRLRSKLFHAGCPVNGEARNGARGSADPDQLPGAWDDPERLTVQAETRLLLDRAIDKLPTRYRQVVCLHDFEDWTMKQIGARLGVDPSRVSQIRGKALTRLRTRLAPQFRAAE